MVAKISRAVTVEDDAPMRELIKIALKTFGISEISQAANGVEAISVLQACKADIVFMDWQMDDMDGLECTRRIRSGIAGIDPKTIIVLLTGMVGKENECTAYAAGVDLFLEKPVSLKKMQMGLAKVLSQPKA